MQSSLISKIEKARRYASEPHRVNVTDLRITFEGDNGDHEVTLADNEWHCNCDFFETWNVCSHTMALERIMSGMVPAQTLPQSQLATA